MQQNGRVMVEQAEEFVKNGPHQSPRNGEGLEQGGER